MVFKRAGDIISLDNEKAGALVMSTSLENYGSTSTDPVRMFARRDAFRTVAEAIAQGIAAVPFDEYEDHATEGRRKVGAHETALSRVLHAPKPRVGQYRFVEALQLDYVLHDRWAFLVEITDAGEYIWHRLPARDIRFAVDGHLTITHVVVWKGTSRELVIPIEFCVFDVGYDPEPSGGYTKGYPIANSLEASAAELDFGSAYRRSLLTGGPKVPMYIQRPAEAPDWIKNGGRQRFIDSFKGFSAERAGEVPVLEDGMKLVDAPQLDVNGIAYRETRLAAQIEFAIAMHYPPELIGYRPGNHSNLEALREQLYIDVLGGKIIAFRQALNLGLRDAGLLPDGHYIEENLGARLASAPDKQASILQTQVGAPVRSVNEARRMLNLPPVPGGDDLIVPLNVTKGGLASPTDTAPKTLAIEAPHAKALTPGTVREAVSVQTARFDVELRAAFARQAARVTKSLGSSSSPGALADAFDDVLEDMELLSVLMPHMYALAVTGAAPVLAAYDPESEGFDPQVMLPWLRKAAEATARRLNTATLAKLAVAVFDDEWTQAVDRVFSELGTSTAPRWSSTLATACVSFGSADVAKSAGLKRKQWKASPGSERHTHLDGETVAADALFSNGLRYPGDQTGESGEVFGCSCAVVWLP